MSIFLTYRSNISAVAILAVASFFCSQKNVCTSKSYKKQKTSVMILELVWSLPRKPHIKNNTQLILPSD